MDSVETAANEPVVRRTEGNDASAAAPADVNYEVAIGSEITGRYLVQEKLGGGGMSVVYRCEDKQGGCCAVKLLKPQLASEERWINRFRQEAKAIGRLKHPNIICVHQFSTEGVVPYIVMDFVEGVSLADLTAQAGSLELNRTLKIMSQVADALQHAHANGVVHRDLKPSNIMLVQTEGSECAKILDFGIAKISDSEEMASKMTQTGEVFGSPAYMSPEQSLGKKVDERTDQYAFGCVMFECLTGGPPFMGDNAVDTLMRQIHYNPPTLKEASLGKTFSKEVEEFVARLLRKDPGQRFASMTEVREQLDELLNPPSPLSKAVRGAQKTDWKHLRSGTLVGLAVGLGLGLLIAYVSWLYRPPTASDLGGVVQETPVPKSSSYLADQELLQLIRRQPDAEALDLSDKALSDAGLTYLPKMFRLQTLRMDKCPKITDRGMVYVGQCARLQNLSVSLNPNITDRGVALLTHLPLMRLQLSQTRVSDSVADTLARMNSLQALDLSECNLQDSGIESISHLPISQLKLAGEYEVTNRGFEVLGRMKSLRELNLNDNVNLGPCLANFGSLDLNTLSLSRTAVRDSDLTVLLKMKHLMAIDLSRTGITDGGLATLAKIKSLRLVRLDDVYSISEAGTNKLRDTLPNAKVQASRFRGKLIRNGREVESYVLKYGMPGLFDQSTSDTK